MKLSEKYEKLKKAAQKDVQDTRNRPNVLAGTYPKKAENLDGLGLLEQVRAAALLGYETHLRVADDCLEVRFVGKLPPMPFEVRYA